MTQDELWQAYATRNPSFASEGYVTMSAAGLRKLFEQTWTIAFESGKRQAEFVAKVNQSVGNPGSDFFNAIFPKK